VGEPSDDAVYTNQLLAMLAALLTNQRSQKRLQGGSRKASAATKWLR
jgi:hypothetical protein